MDKRMRQVLEDTVAVYMVQKASASWALESTDPIFAAANGIACWAKSKIDAEEGSCLAWNCSDFLFS